MLIKLSPLIAEFLVRQIAQYAVKTTSLGSRGVRVGGSEDAGGVLVECPGLELSR